MGKLRSVSTAFWSDPFVEDLTPNQKLLFLYLITNEKTNMLGIYEASIKKISFETGIKKEDVQNALKDFEKIGKVKYVNNFVVLVNYMKHQNFNTNMKKSAIDIYNNLPKELKGNDLSISKDNPIKGFERLLNHYGMVRKVEVESEEEEEVESEEEVKDIKNTFKEKKVKFLIWFNLKKQKHTGKIGNFKVLTSTDDKNLKKLYKDYGAEEFEIAVNNLFKSKWPIENNMLTPSHYLRVENFNKYLNQSDSVKRLNTFD